MALVTDRNTKKALTYLYKTKIIMEYHLQQEFDKNDIKETIFDPNGKDIAIFETDSDIEIEDCELHRELTVPNESDPDSVANLKGILDDIYTKVIFK